MERYIKRDWEKDRERDDTWRDRERIREANAMAAWANHTHFLSLYQGFLSRLPKSPFSTNSSDEKEQEEEKEK